MSKKKIMSAFRKTNAEEFIESIDNPSSYYMFVAKHTPYDDESDPDQPLDTESYVSDVYREMIFGKRVSNTDVSMVVARNEWVINTVYTQYDDADTALFSKQFFVYVNDGDYYHTFKCLYNNEGAASTVRPDFASVSEDDEVYETSDGYIWKYMYSVNSAQVAKFATAQYFPVTSNTEIQAGAVRGAIDVIKVVSGGNNYANYLTGENMFSSSQLRVGSNTRIYDISSNATASSYNDFYNGCYMYISAGTGIGQYKMIVDYITTPSAKNIVLESEFETPLTVDSVFNIYPGVVIASTGSQTSNAVARAIVNSVSNTIYKIDMLNHGAGYQIATANVFAHSTVTATEADLRVINSPYDGHGSDAVAELGSISMCMSVTFANSEANTIPINNDYRTIGVMKNPLYANVNVEALVKQGELINGEILMKIKPKLISTSVTFTAEDTTVTCETGDFENQFEVNDYIYFKKSTDHHIAMVESITNSTVLVVDSAFGFSSNSTLSANMYMTVSLSNSVIISSNATNVLTANVSQPILTDDQFIGLSSRAYLVANTISISNESKDFDTFVNMYKYEGTITSGTFIEDEVIYQSDITLANGIFHSTEVKDSLRYFYLTNVYGDIQVEKTLSGVDSGALAYINNVYQPEIVFKSGEIIYLENIDAVERDPAQSEKFKLIFEL